MPRPSVKKKEDRGGPASGGRLEASGMGAGDEGGVGGLVADSTAIEVSDAGGGGGGDGGAFPAVH